MPKYNSTPKKSSAPSPGFIIINESANDRIIFQDSTFLLVPKGHVGTTSVPNMDAIEKIRFGLEKLSEAKAYVDSYIGSHGTAITQDVSDLSNFQFGLTTSDDQYRSISGALAELANNVFSVNILNESRKNLNGIEIVVDSSLSGTNIGGSATIDKNNSGVIFLNPDIVATGGSDLTNIILHEINHISSGEIIGHVVTEIDTASGKIIRHTGALDDIDYAVMPFAISSGSDKIKISYDTTLNIRTNGISVADLTTLDEPAKELISQNLLGDGGQKISERMLVLLNEFLSTKGSDYIDEAVSGLVHEVSIEETAGGNLYLRETVILSGEIYKKFEQVIYEDIVVLKDGENSRVYKAGQLISEQHSEDDLQKVLRHIVPETVDFVIGAEIGSTLGSTLGHYLGGDNPFAQVGAGAVLSAFGKNIGEVIDWMGQGADLIPSH